MARARRDLELRRPLVVLISLGWLVIGLIGLRGYWESYYQHRGFAPIARRSRACLEPAWTAG